MSRWNFEREYKEPLDLFQSCYHDLHYNFVFDLAANDTFYLFNPETIVKITVPSIEHKVENLYIRKRYEEALEVVNNTYQRPMLGKVQAAHLNDLI